jgi:DNA sulfur modification protein DndD
MYLRRIELKDWKAFAAATIDVPAPSAERNVVLVGARNGFGKTSLFEAIILGLFGRDGLNFIARAPFGLSAVDRVQVSYNNFLASGLHKSALKEGRPQCSVSLTFEAEQDEKLIIRRIWYFSPDGKHKPADEELRIYRGRDERLEGPPPNEDEIEWRRAFIAKELLPHNLASFFLFDGEQVQALADRDMSAQIRAGIEGLLGIQIMRELAVDLRKYATARRSEVGGGRSTPKELERLRTDIDLLEHQNDKAKDAFSTATAEWERLSSRRDVLTRELAAMGAGSGDTTIKERFEELNRVKRTLEELFERLQSLVTDELSLVLAGRRLRERTMERLKAEQIREDWEAGRKQSEAGLTRFLDAVSTGLLSVEPSLHVDQRNAIVEVIRSQWDSLWFPAPPGCADRYLHGYLRGPDRDVTFNALNHLSSMTNNDLNELLERINQAERSRSRLENEIARLEGISPQLEEKAKELKELNREIDRLATERGRLQREIEALTGQLNQKRAELARYADQINRAGPNTRRANWADRVATVIDAIVAEAVPGQIQGVSAAMTRAFRAMSHKGLVEKVEIDDSCNVKLFSAAGVDVRELALSAGEQQIFAQALISAIAEISQRNFPIIVDTPLGRLDDAHRSGVLKQFTARGNQVILLSTDTEVTGPYLDLVQPRLAATFRIDHDVAMGQSKIIPGYFSEVEA